MMPRQDFYQEENFTLGSTGEFLVNRNGRSEKLHNLPRPAPSFFPFNRSTNIRLQNNMIGTFRPNVTQCWILEFCALLSLKVRHFSNRHERKDLCSRLKIQHLKSSLCTCYYIAVSCNVHIPNTARLWQFYFQDYFQDGALTSVKVIMKKVSLFWVHWEW